MEPEKRITVSIPWRTYESMCQVSDDTGKSQAQIVREALEEYLHAVKEAK